jgi:hypothetical protein
VDAAEDARAEHEGSVMRAGARLAAAVREGDGLVVELPGVGRGGLHTDVLGETERHHGVDAALPERRIQGDD